MLRTAAAIVSCGIVLGQTRTPAFEVVSLKPSTGALIGAPNSDGGPGTRYPERFATNATLRGLIFRAFGLVDIEEQISGPKWIDTDKFAIDARMPAGTTVEEFHTMLQNLLAERFKLEVHHETKVLRVYELGVAKNGPKLKESAAASGVGPVTYPDGLKNDANGFPVLPPDRPGFISSFGPGLQSHWTARQQSMPQLARMLRQPNAVMDLVIDKTGLTGRYDFTLEYTMQPRAGAAVERDDTPGSNLFEALEQQLGLKLAETKAPFDVVVIDRAERTPTEN